MNALPTGPFHLGKDLEAYFAQLEAFRFDVAYIAYYAYGWEKTTGEFKRKYIAFAEEAHRRGYKACVQIQTVLALEEDIPIAEAQYFSGGDPVSLGPGVFMASYGSRIWRDFLKRLGRLFVREYGYDWIVHEEPCWPVDVPGEPDRVCRLFREKYPEVRYPFNAEGTSLTAEQFRINFRLLDRRMLRVMRERHRAAMDSREYEILQRFKQDILVDYYEELARDAKEAGAEKFGLMPWMFTPTSENAPAVTMNACNHLGRLGMIEELDLLIVRMQPDNIYYHDDPFNGLIDEQGEAEPRLNYLETMAHQLGKQVIAVNNPMNERNFLVSRTGEHGSPLPKDFFQRCTLAIVAANPNGMTRHWYDHQHFVVDGQHPEESSYAHNLFMADLLPWLTRLGSPMARLGFIFSFEAACRANPPGRDNTWRSYYRFIKEMMFVQQTPAKTLYASVLRKQLAAEPEIDVVVLCEQHQLGAEDRSALEEWLGRKGGRRLIGYGSSDHWQSWPEPKDEVQREQRNGLVTTVIRKPNGSEIRFFELDLREASPGQIAVPVSHALRETDAEPWVKSESDDVLWSPNRWGYLSICNTGPSLAVIRARPTKGRKLYDVRRQRWEERNLRSLPLQPYEFLLWKAVQPSVPWLDVQGQTTIVRVSERESERTAAFTLETGPDPISFDVAEWPLAVRLDGKDVTEASAAPDSRPSGGKYRLQIAVEPGRTATIELQWNDTQ